MSVQVRDINGNVITLATTVDGSGNTVPLQQQLGSLITGAGKVTNTTSADTTIAPTSGFNHISIVNDDPTYELRIGIDVDSTLTTNIIYIAGGETLDLDVTGSVLHYSAATGAPPFRYILRS